MLDAKAVTGMYKGSDHYVLLAKIKKVDGSVAVKMARER